MGKKKEHAFPKSKQEQNVVDFYCDFFKLKITVKYKMILFLIVPIIISKHYALFSK